MSTDNELYHSDVSRISNSMLSLLKESPRKFYDRYELGKVTQPSEAMVVGSLCHCMVFEPSELLKRFCVAPKVDRRYTEGKKIWSEFLLSCEGKTPIEADVFGKSSAACSLARMHPEYQWFSANPGMIEARIDFELDGVGCKCKPDHLHLEREVIWDLKTTVNASPKEFAKSVAAFGYHRQAAIYREAVRKKFGVDCRFLFLVVEKEYPWECGVYELDEITVEQGMHEIYALLREYRARKAANKWEQVWSDGVVPVSLPKWYRSNLYELEEVEA